MNYKLEEKPALTLVGVRRHFTGTPNDKQDQDHNFACETRLEQAVLKGLSYEYEDIYGVLTNFDGEGYDYALAYRFPDWALEDLKELPPEFAARFETISHPGRAVSGVRDGTGRLPRQVRGAAAAGCGEPLDADLRL